MGQEYRINWKPPTDYNPATLLQKLPSPISAAMTEIYNYSVDQDGFYFVDHLIDQKIAGYAMKMFIDEALCHASSVEILEI